MASPGEWDSANCGSALCEFCGLGLPDECDFVNCAEWRCGFVLRIRRDSLSMESNSTNCNKK